MSRIRFTFGVAVFVLVGLDPPGGREHACAGAVDNDLPPLCAHSEPDATLPSATASTTPRLMSWSLMGDDAVVLEYRSVYDVHTPPDPSRPIRSQPGSFFTSRILADLECFVDPAMYHFVFLYTVQEVPGWIHAGARGILAPAKNIGFGNSMFGAPSMFPNWSRLLLAPHMNSVDLIDQNPNGDFGPLAAAHEMGHAWNVYWAQQSHGPRNWQPGDPPAWLGACCGHWSWNWVDADMPGMMYSAPTAPRFNEFDLYAMGLMSYDEASSVTHAVYEVLASGLPGPVHSIALDDLRFSLSLQGPGYYEGDGRRIPAIDPEVRDLVALIVIVKGASETLTPDRKNAVMNLAGALPTLWSEATGGRSALTVKARTAAILDADGDGIADCVDNCPTAANASQDDADDDGIGDECDPCPHVPHPNFWDLDHLGGFNLRDFQVFQNCFSGDRPATPQCMLADFAGGGTIDLADYIPVGELLSGACDSPSD